MREMEVQGLILMKTTSCKFLSEISDRQTFKDTVKEEREQSPYNKAFINLVLYT